MSDATVYSGMYLRQHAVSVHRKGRQGDDLSLLPKWHYLYPGSPDPDSLLRTSRHPVVTAGVRYFICGFVIAGGCGVLKGTAGRQYGSIEKNEIPSS